MPDDNIDESLIIDAIQKAAAGPKEISSDAGQVTQYSLMDLIEAHKYLLTTKNAGQTNRASGLRFAQLIPGGTVQRGYRTDTGRNCWWR